MPRKSQEQNIVTWKFRHPVLSAVMPLHARVEKTSVQQSFSDTARGHSVTKVKHQQCHLQSNADIHDEANVAGTVLYIMSTSYYILLVIKIYFHNRIFTRNLKRRYQNFMSVRMQFCTLVVLMQMLVCLRLF